MMMRVPPLELCVSPRTITDLVLPPVVKVKTLPPVSLLVPDVACVLVSANPDLPESFSLYHEMTLSLASVVQSAVICPGTPFCPWAAAPLADG